MTPSKPKSARYEYSQYAFRASKEEVDAIQKEMDVLYEKFNKGRDPKDPKGRRAVKISDIALEALKLGLIELKKRSKWRFEA